MKPIFISLFFILISTSTFAQKTISNSFVIKDNTSSFTESFINKSISGSNLESFRLKEKRNVIQFENGFSVEMLSAKELLTKGLISATTDYVDVFQSDIHLKKFSLLSTGLIAIGTVEKTHPKSSKK